MIDGHDFILETCKSGTCQTELPSPRGFTPDKSSPLLSSSLDPGMSPPGSRGQDHYRDSRDTSQWRSRSSCPDQRYGLSPHSILDGCSYPARHRKGQDQSQLSKVLVQALSGFCNFFNRLSVPSREVTTAAAFPLLLGINLARLELSSKTQHGDCGHWAGM